MLSKKMWNIFKNTGNIQAYLYYKQYNGMIESEEMHKSATALQRRENSKVNSI